MPTSCVAVACTERHIKGSSVSFHRFPVQEGRRKQWAAAVKREGWIPMPAHRICGKHFVTGEPSDDPHHPDYVPTIFAHKKNKRTAAAARLQRAKARALAREVQEPMNTSPSSDDQVMEADEAISDVGELVVVQF
ncbi:THAP domain-containing protein 2-like [Amblyomma americanum]